MSSLNKEYRYFRFALIIPFFNEEKRINHKSFTGFAIQNKDVLLILVNDGSTDKTGSILESIRIATPQNIEIISLGKNSGKGNAIRAGMTKALAYQIPFIAYLDADLSAPFEEILRLYEYLPGTDYLAVFGSRIKKLGSDIRRSQFRHITGRIIATIIDSRFKIGCYDTQCSAKIFTSESLRSVIQQPFFTRWFFDVELILRIIKKTGDFKVLEIPLNYWEHQPGSKINALAAFRVIKEIYTLFTKY